MVGLPAVLTSPHIIISPHLSAAGSAVGTPGFGLPPAAWDPSHPHPARKSKEDAMHHRDRFKYHSYLEQTEQALNLLHRRLAEGGAFQAVDEPVDLEARFLKAERLYLRNANSSALPLPAPVYLTVEVVSAPGCDCSCPCPPEAVIAATQFVWSDPDGDIRYRLGTVTQAAGQEAQVEWGQWREIGGGAGGCACPDNLVTRDQVRTRLTGPITFYITKGGNDQTGDGLTESTALATWSGFYNRYVTGPEAFDARRNTITIQYGPGQWFDQISLLGQDYINPGRLVINGSGMDNTIFSSPIQDPNSFSFSICGDHSLRSVISNCGFDQFGKAVCANQGGLASIKNVKFKQGNTPGKCYAIYADHNGRIIPDGTVDIYFEGFNGQAAIMCHDEGWVQLNSTNIHLIGNNTWTYFANVITRGGLRLAKETFTCNGTGTGRKFRVTTQGLIYGTSNDLNLLPGTIAGTVETATGGVYC